MQSTLKFWKSHRTDKMAYFGKTFTLERQEKFDEFLASMGLPKDQIDAMVSEQATQTLSKDGDTYTISIRNSPVSFKSGVEFEETIRGKKSKTTFVVDGNTVTQVQKIVDGPTITFKREFSGDKLVVTATNSLWDGAAIRYYSA